jgi:hypothetical protein
MAAARQVQRPDTANRVARLMVRLGPCRLTRRGCSRWAYHSSNDDPAVDERIGDVAVRSGDLGAGIHGAAVRGSRRGAGINGAGRAAVSNAGVRRAAVSGSRIARTRPSDAGLKLCAAGDQHLDRLTDQAGGASVARIGIITIQGTNSSRSIRGKAREPVAARGDASTVLTGLPLSPRAAIHAFELSAEGWPARLTRWAFPGTFIARVRSGIALARARKRRDRGEDQSQRDVSSHWAGGSYQARRAIWKPHMVIGAGER